MRKPIFALIATIMLACGSAGVAADPPAPSAAEAASLAQAEARGRLIYAYDRAAWLGTDDMLAKLSRGAEIVGGWLVEGPADSPRLLFYDRDEVEPHFVYVASFEGGRLAGHVVTDASEKASSPPQRALIAATRAARNTFMQSNVLHCSTASVNTVVLPPERPGDTTRVYFLSPQERTDRIPFGGHYVVEVDGNGRPGPPRAFSKSCLEMPLSPPAGRSAAMMVVSHILDPVPTEIHVFNSLVITTPLLVVTTSNRRGWKIDHGRISAFPLDGMNLPDDRAS